MVLLLTTVISCLVQLFSLSLKQSINSLFELTSQPPCQLFSDVKMLMDLLGSVVCMYVCGQNVYKLYTHVLWSYNGMYGCS